MALNCSMISSNNDPIPLPGEKIFLSVRSVSISLSPTTPGQATTDQPSISPTSPIHPIDDPDSKKKGKLPSIAGMLSTFSSLASSNPSIDGSTDGTIYVTNQRILFIAQNASSLSDPIPSSDPNQPTRIKTLTVPLRNSFDGRFVQPWLSPNYHLSTVIPVPNGQLDRLFQTHDPNLSSHHPIDSFSLKVVFHQGHGFEFYEALEEVKNIMFQSESERPADIEDLPTYSPPVTGSIPLNDGFDPSSSDHTGHLVPSPANNSQNLNDNLEDPPPPSIDDPAGSATLLPRRNTIPEPDLLLAASVATREELVERSVMTQEPPRVSSLEPLPSELRPADDPAAPHSDAPPGYEP